MIVRVLSPLQQGQGEEHPGDELGGHVPRQGCIPRPELALDGEHVVLGRRWHPRTPPASSCSVRPQGALGRRPARWKVTWAPRAPATGRRKRRVEPLSPQSKSQGPGWLGLVQRGHVVPLVPGGGWTPPRGG